MYQSNSRKESTSVTIVSEHVTFEGGKLIVGRDTVIDACLKGVHIVTRGEPRLKLSALSRLDECIVDCDSVEMEGDFRGEVKASGDVNVSDSASIAGIVRLAGRLNLSAHASLENVRVSRLDQYVQAEVLDENGRPLA